MDKFFFSFLSLTNTQNEIKKIKEKQDLIKKEEKLKNMITNNIDNFQLVDKGSVEDYQLHIKNTCMDLMNISSYMKELGIHCKEKDIENQIRDYTRTKDMKRKLILESRRKDLEQRFNVMFLLKQNNMYIQDYNIFLNQKSIKNYDYLIVSKNTYTINLGELKFAFVRNNVYQKPINIVEGEVSKEIETYENVKYKISKQKLIFYSGKITFTVVKIFNNMSFLIDGRSIEDGYNKIKFSSEKVL